MKFIGEALLVSFTLLTLSASGFGQPLKTDALQFRSPFASQMDTSSPAVAPPWSMKPWFWEDDVNTAAAVWDLVDGCKKHDLPLGAVLIDSPWTTAYNNFDFDQKRYSNPRQMIDALHARQVRVVVWMTNIINTKQDKADAPGSEEDLYAVGKARGYFVNGGKPIKWWKGKGALIDYTNPRAVAWWHRLMDRALALGVDGWKLDGAAELFLLTERQTSRGVLSLRDYVDLYYRDSFHYGRHYCPDFVTMARSVDIANSAGSDLPHAPFDAAPLTWVGDQRHTWTGKGIDEAARSTQRALERGYPSVSSDTGGYQSDPKHPRSMPRQLYLRWAQWNAFTPFLLIGGHDEHRPWKFDPAFLQVFRRYLWLHSELVPYFYSLHVQASLREGRLMHPGPAKNEFLLGDELLVGVPVNETARQAITFPAGHWLDYWDNRHRFQGGTTVQIQCTEDKIPVFVKQGAIIALDVENAVAGHGSERSKGCRTLDIYASSEPSSTVIWDARIFPPSTSRDRTFVVIEPTDHSATIRFEGGPARNTILRIHEPRCPSSVRRAGKEMLKLNEQRAWEQSTDGWWHDTNDQRLWIRSSALQNDELQLKYSAPQGGV